MGKATGAKHGKEKAAEKYEHTHPCEKCAKKLVDPSSSLGHSDKVCKAFKAEKDRNDAEKAAKAKRAASKAKK